MLGWLEIIPKEIVASHLSFVICGLQPLDSWGKPRILKKTCTTLDQTPDVVPDDVHALPWPLVFLHVLSMYFRIAWNLAYRERLIIIVSPFSKISYSFAPICVMQLILNKSSYLQLRMSSRWLDAVDIVLVIIQETVRLHYRNIFLQSSCLHKTSSW